MCKYEEFELVWFSKIGYVKWSKGKRMENRGRLGLDKLSDEISISWNAGNSATASDEFFKDSLEKRFGKNRSDWHFTTKTKQTSLLKFHTTSNTVDKIRKQKGRIAW